MTVEDGGAEMVGLFGLVLIPELCSAQIVSWLSAFGTMVADALGLRQACT